MGSLGGDKVKGGYVYQGWVREELRDEEKANGFHWWGRPKAIHPIKHVEIFQMSWCWEFIRYS